MSIAYGAIGTNQLIHRYPSCRVFRLVGLSILATMSIMQAAEFQDPEDITFNATVDGSVQKYVRMMPKPAVKGGPTAALICLHGAGSDRWQYVKEERGECRGARDVAARHGMMFISPDYRASASWMGPTAEADLKQIITELRVKRGVTRIFLAGASMGGTGSLIFTALHPELIDGVYSANGMGNMVTYDNFAESIALSYGGSKKDQPDEYRKRSAELFPERFTMPIAITVGGKDEVVPPMSVLRLGAALTKAKRRVLVINRETTGHVTDYDDTVQALEFMLKAAADSPVKKGKK
ncbi:MAG: prolyl oligopeptidase family serine peptidase [Planctomycetes bacterium]|nr:prolyl oligopeptidase family serine peptidase [Planctomycetota bacterium]